MKLYGKEKVNLSLAIQKTELEVASLRSLS